MIKAILFDLDNTLIDFMTMKTVSISAAVDAMRKAGLKKPKKESLELIYELYLEKGMEDPKIFQKFLKKTNNNIDYRILASAIVAYRKARKDYLKPYKGVRPVLLELGKKYKLAIVTDAPKLKAWIRMVHLQVDTLFDVVVAKEDTGRLKPSKMPFLAAIKKLEVKPGECLMVGDDQKKDIKGAKTLGIKTCFARYGNKEAKNSKADYVINEFEELLRIF